MTDSPQVPEQLAHCNRPPFPGKIGDVGLNLGIQVDFTLLNQLQDGYGGHGLGV